MIAKDRLIFPLDVPDAQEARKHVALLGEHVGVFKIGLELFVSEGPPIVDTRNKFSLEDHISCQFFMQVETFPRHIGLHPSPDISRMIPPAIQTSILLPY